MIRYNAQKNMLLIILLLIFVGFTLYIYSGMLEANPKMRNLEHSSYCMAFDPNKEQIEKAQNIKIEKFKVYDCDSSGFCCVSYEYKELTPESEITRPEISSSDLQQEEIESRYADLVNQVEKYENLMFKCETIRNANQFNDLMVEINTLDSKHNLENAMLDFNIKIEPESKLYNEVSNAIKKSNYIQDGIDECLDRKALEIWK